MLRMYFPILMQHDLHQHYYRKEHLEKYNDGTYSRGQGFRELTYTSTAYSKPIQGKPCRERCEDDIKNDISKCDAQILEISARKYEFTRELLQV